MADKIIKSVKFLPEFLQTPKNAKFLSSTIDQLIRKPELERLDGYIGSTRTPNYRSGDVYISEATELRSNYQLEPSLIVKDQENQIKDVLSINDIINEINLRGGNADNFDRLFRTSYYSYDPHIDEDKFINYQNYYWLVNGPSVINITDTVNVTSNVLGQAQFSVSSLNISLMNGMRIRFTGTVTPTIYQDKVYYVEGVGSSIKLIDETLLSVSEKIASIYDDSFDQALFDEFPFDSYKRLPLIPDYITINRSSEDLNPWTRYNRWVHKDIIQISAEINDLTPNYPVKLRAQRPIIEFKPNIKLYNFGNVGVKPLDLVDNVTTDVFSTVEGSAGHYVDGVLLQQGNRVIFTADTDLDVRNKIYEVNYITINGKLRLTLIQIDESIIGSTTFVNSGIKFGGTSWWFTGLEWKFAQQHTILNQPPLFDLFDSNGASYSDQESYSSNFKGNKIFGYEIGTGQNDPVLGFPLKYQNSIGVGSYLFRNYLNTDSIILSTPNGNAETISTQQAFLKIENTFYNSWKSSVEYPIPIITSQINTASSFYDLPLGLTNNPLNGPIATLTLSDYRDHISTSSETRLISNINPMPFALMFLGKQEHNVIDALTKAADQYNTFKLSLIKKITELSIENDPIRALDEALKSINVSKTVSSPYYLSDMIAYGDDYIEKTFIVSNINVTSYPISSEFNLNDISLRSILVYLNDNLLLVGKDYSFDDNDSYITFNVQLNLNDQIIIKDFSSTKGCYIPSTPSKLGLYPKFQPRKFLDDSYLEAKYVIEGHDGSILIAFNDYRDDIILEYEKRVYNNIKGTYHRELLDFHSVIPGAFRTTEYTNDEINKILEQDFVRWTTTYGIDPTINSGYTLDDSYTWNYTGSYIPELNLNSFGSWRALLNYLYDTDRPDLNPWEMLGFTEQPDWWEQIYGTAPYASTNLLLWGDLETGLIRQGDRAGIDTLYARPGLSSLLPTDAAGMLEDPDEHVINILPANTRATWKFGDWGQSETAWRRSSYWPFVVQKILALTKPAIYTSLFYDPIRLKKNASNQWVYGDNYKFLNLKEMPVQGLNDYLTTGYSVYVSEAGRQRTADYNDELLEDLTNLDINLFYRAGGFIDKSQLQISIDSYDPLSTAPGSVLQPEDYTLILNVSNPIRESAISGIVVQRTDNKFLIKGLDLQNPYFTIYSPIRNPNTPAITVGGVSESFVNWAPSSSSGNSGLSAADTTSASAAAVGTYYEKGQYVKYSNKFYITTVSHRSGSVFETEYFREIPSLPIKGGSTVQTSIGFDKTTEIKVPYGTIYNTIQQVYDLIIGYGSWLIDQGFTFDQYNVDLQSTLDWNYSAKEFLYWTTQNWSDKSVIALSPFSDSLTIKLTDAVIDNIFNNFYEYSILEASGQALPQRYLDVVREEGRCEIKTNTPYRGIYFARLYSIQKEHAIVFNNKTIFNDSIFNIETGYRQARMNLLGFRTSKWNGDYFSPGFVYDTAIISDWKQFKDYKFEDVVRFNSNYYAAVKNLNGSSSFNFDDWRLLGKKPVAALIGNFDYKIQQFEDFYSLDTNNFDEVQQQAAQHLIGYTPRVYLNNIFADPISQYKFYQGFIREKGTKNSIAKLERATVQNLNGKINYNEEWAFRMGYYGSYSSNKEIEIPLIEGTFAENPQIIKFVTANSTVTNLQIEILPKDLSIKPLNYKSTQTFSVSTELPDDVFKVTNAGYARFDDVDLVALNESEILNFTNTEVIQQGQTIWLANDKLKDWTILRKKLSLPKLVRVESDPNTVDQYLFTTNRPHEFSAGQIVTIEEFDDSINGIYIISSIIDRDTFAIVDSELVITETIQPDNLGLIFTFDKARYNSFDNLPTDSELLSLPRNSKVWTDSDDQGNWKVYQKIKNYKSFTLSASSSPIDQDLGYSISKQKSSIYMVGSPGYFQSGLNKGNIFVYENRQNFSTLITRYGINDNSVLNYYDKSLPSGFGNAVFYDVQEFIDINGPTGYGLLFAGAPLASKVSIPAVMTLTQTLVEQGLVKISSINAETITENTVAVIKSPNPSNNERYGSSIFVLNNTSTKVLLVGAPFTPTIGTGTVYRYVLNTSTINTGTLEIVSTASISLNYSSVSRIDIINSGTNYKVNDIIKINYPKASGTLTAKVTKVWPNGGIKSFAAPLDNSIVFNENPGTIITTATFTATTTGSGFTFNIVTSNELGSQWGSVIAGSENDSFNKRRGIVAVGAPGFSFGKGLVAIFTNTNTTVSQILISPFENNSNFGSSIAVSPSGNYIYVGAVNARATDQSYGKVAVYKRESSTQTFTLTQVISNPVPGVGMKFGQSIDINIDDEELVISAIGTNRRINVSFDDYTLPLVTNPDFKYDNDPNSEYSIRDTSYDIDSTYFIDRVVYSGSVYVYNRKNNLYKAADELPPVNINSGTNYGFNVSINEGSIFVGAPAVVNENDSTINSAVHHFYKVDQNASSWKLLRYQESLVKTDSIQKVALIDTLKDEVIDYLEVVDPLKGKIIGIAEQELSFKLSYDPAVYSIGDSTVVVDLNTNWLADHVGALWWDLSTVKYPWYEQGEDEYRKNYWGIAFPGSTIDVYEWVETQLLPSQWAVLADTKEGLTQGISGQPKYLDNNNLSVRQVYNKISGTFSNYYYYWVKNTVIVPPTKNRRISAYQVARLIENPRTQGERFIEVLSPSSLAIANCSNLLIDNRIHLNVISDEINNSVPRHTEWLILQEGSSYSKPPEVLEKKLLDSLKGTDSLGNLVPDPNLSSREKYGINIRPRQSMFKDRIAALRNAIEYVNGILIDERVTGIYNFNNLNKQESPPDITSNEYDQVVEDNLDLELIDTAGFETAELTCAVSNGKIISVTIVNPGYGYKVSPSVEIENNLYNARIITEIDSVGRVVDTTIVNSGRMFVDPPIIKVRPYSVLVLADETYNGKWTRFIYDNAEFILWKPNTAYAYGQKVKYNNNYYAAKNDLPQSAQFNSSDWIILPLSQLDGRWVRARTQLYNTPLYWNYIDWVGKKYNKYKNPILTINSAFDLSEVSLNSGDYVKIRDNGLGNYIILEKLNAGQPGSFTLEYDIVYEENGTIQISDSIWNSSTGNLGFDKNTYDQTLYSQSPDLELQYILDALKDDIFVGDLKVYWNLLFFKSVRYALTEQKLLDWAFKTSFINVINQAGELKQLPVYKLANATYYEDYLMEAKPYHTQIRSFTTNYSLSDTSQSYITDFDLPPVYDPNQGKIITVNSGSNYLSQYPWKSWADNFGSTDTVRVNQITLRYDRISRSQQIENLEVTDSFIANGIRTEYQLSWLAEPNNELIDVFLENNKVLESDYQIIYYKDQYNGYLKKFSKLVFTAFIPSLGQKISINYRKNTELLSAVDRTLSFYSPTNEMPGKDLAQLMAGIEYPQTNLEGLSLNYSTQWGDSFVGFDGAPYEDELSFYTFTTSTVISGSFAATLTLVQVASVTGIEKGQTVNIFSSTSTFFASSGPSDEPRVWAVNTASRYVYINKPALTPIPAGSKLEFWNYNESPSALDSQIIGGDFSYVISTDTGAIIVDGDAFITPDTSYAPEELIPGELNESLGINVYTKAPVQSPIILASSIDIITPYTTTTRQLTVVPPSPAGVIVTYNNSVVTATITEVAEALTTTIYLSTLTGISLFDPIYTIPGIQEQTSVSGFTGTNGIIINKPLISQLTTGTILQVVKINRPTIFEYAEFQSTGTIFTSANQFTIDWTNDNGKHPLLIIPPQPRIGKLSYTVITMGGASTDNQTGFIDSTSAVVDDVTFVELESLSSIDTVKSAYVTVNGNAIPAASISTTTYFVLTYANELNKRAAVKVYNLNTGTNAVSAWFFGTEQKLWNEIKEEIKTVPQFTKTFKGIATLNDPLVTDIDDMTGIVPGIKVYARNTTGGFYVPWNTSVGAVSGNTITIIPVPSLPPGSGSTATLEFGIVLDGYVEIASTGTYNSTFAYPPGNIKPEVANTIIEFNNNKTNSRRMLIPPRINYYSVENPAFNTFAITNKDLNGNLVPLSINEIRVYLNGNELRRGFDFVLVDQNPPGTIVNIVKIESSLLNVGDVIAILNKPGSSITTGGYSPGPYYQDFEYDIYNDNLLLCASPTAQLLDPSTAAFNAYFAGWNTDWQGEIKIITYNNHDHLLMRTETFDGNPSGRFKISRPILDESYVWVSINGIPLANYVDFEILDDQMTVQITDSYALTSKDVVTIISFSSNKTTADILGFRIFNDLFNRYHYKRLSKINSTELTQSLADTDSVIYVKDAGVLTKPIIGKNIPGVVLINGERIEFFTITGNVLGQLRRGTLGTSPKVFSQSGTAVIDQGTSQSIPYADRILKQNTLTEALVNTYFISTSDYVYQYNTGTLSTGTWFNDGINLVTLELGNSTIDPSNQIEVYYGGRKLNKGYTYYQDPEISFDSQEIRRISSLLQINTTATTAGLPAATERVGTTYIVTTTNQVWVYENSLEENAISGYVYRGLIRKDPEFTLNTSTQEITLNIDGGVQDGIRLTIIKKEFSTSTLWNNGVSLLDSDSNPAKFLKARSAELPDDDYYGGDFELTDNSGAAFTDDQGDPLIGIN